MLAFVYQPVDISVARSENSIASGSVSQPWPALVVTTHVNQRNEPVDAPAHRCVERTLDPAAVAEPAGQLVDRLVGKASLQLTDALARHADLSGKGGFAVTGCILAQSEYPVECSWCLSIHVSGREIR